jgi:arylsulfatase A-like enzyme
MAGCIDYYSHIFYWGMNRPGPGRNPTHDLWEDNEERWDNGRYFTEMIADKAIAYMREAAQREEPFFLYVPFNAPHYPMHAPQKYLDRFPGLDWDRQIMAAMLSAVDDAVGEIMAELERLGLAEDTLTVFTSDNGPSRESRNWLDGTLDPYYGGSAGKLKGHKFSLYDGGIRMPALMHWPARISASQVLDAPCASMDVFPTMLSAANGDLDAYELDGVNLIPYVIDGQSPVERDIYWEMNDQTAVRRGPWKLVLNGRLVEGAPPEDAVHLANLRKDMGERHNLKDARPEITEELCAAARRWRTAIERRWETEFSPDEQGLVTHA